VTDAPATGIDLDRLVLRPVRPATSELEACAGIWRVSIDAYTTKLGQPPLPDEVAPLLRLYRHLAATDPDGFVVAVDGERIVGFAAAVEREHLWFLSMCFVLPEAQGRGLARRLLDRVLPPAEDPLAARRIRATATDSAQPISNALYASLGIVPRVPLLNLVGPPPDPRAFDALPDGIRAVSFEEIAGAATGDGAAAGHQRLAAAVDALDRETLGVAHPLDHRFLRQEGRRGWLYHGPDAAPLAYAYASEAGRVGPVAVRDEALLVAVVGDVLTRVVPRGAFAMWLPGTAGELVARSLRAGFRLEPWPVLLCWDRPVGDLARYLPISPGLL
jgi:GNAT superfamily N-acetyltransferase